MNAGTAGIVTTPVRNAAIDTGAGCFNVSGAVCDAVVVTVEAAANMLGAAVDSGGVVCTLCC